MSRKTAERKTVPKMDKADDHRKELIKLIKQLAQKYSVWRVFEDFLTLAAISISNSIDWTHKEARETEYMEVVNRYDKDEVELFPQMFAHLVEEMETHVEHLQDVLGGIFHELELHNKYKGQFFTPQHLGDFIGLATLGPDNPELFKGKDYITVAEPCAGSGVLILGFANAMKTEGLDFQNQMVVTATDIDLKCVYMTYLQLSLYGIPAVVIHGNSITLEEWSRWYTPVYMLNGWVWRQKCGNLDRDYAEDEAIKRATEPTYAAIRDVEALTADAEPSTTPPVAVVTENYDVTLRTDDDGQYMLDF